MMNESISHFFKVDDIIINIGDSLNFGDHNASFILFFHEEEEYIVAKIKDFPLIGELMKSSEEFPGFGQARLSRKIDIYKDTHFSRCMLTQTTYNQIFIEGKDNKACISPLVKLRNPGDAKRQMGLIEVKRAHSIQTYFNQCVREDKTFCLFNYVKPLIMAGLISRNVILGQIDLVTLYPCDFPNSQALVFPKILFEDNFVNLPGEPIPKKLGEILETLWVKDIDYIVEFKFNFGLSFYVNHDLMIPEEWIDKYNEINSFLIAHKK